MKKWKCPKCGRTMTQPAAVVEVAHRCTSKSRTQVQLQPVKEATR